MKFPDHQLIMISFGVWEVKFCENNKKLIGKKESRTSDVAHDFHWQKNLFYFFFLVKLQIEFVGINFNLFPPHPPIIHNNYFFGSNYAVGIFGLYS